MVSAELTENMTLSLALNTFPYAIIQLYKLKICKMISAKFTSEL